MKVLQVVGYKNSGKTTLTKEIITYYSKKGWKVGTIKNHGHGGIPIGLHDTDSEQHRRAGSKIAGVIGENILQLSQEEWEVETIISIYELLGIELLVLEGFKRLEYPKLILIKDRKEIQLLTSLSNIIALISKTEKELVGLQLPVFDNKDIEQICNCISMHILKENDDE
ncbi:molybdopterin-guanine dinucleotide biosynthesis protein B [Ornithinibacillus xuwenensis]|uniref:Molybdopterin-guanine dinucleotide biosynthesis protein B n=1 Tax=Ornithinibacillus xuwenensis TaxID=3144668 RepID=A0ABU9XGI8_9BACI